MKTMKKAFTAIELTFVIVIIGILAAIAVPKLMATRDDAVFTKTIQDVEILIKDVMSLYVSQGKAAFKPAAKTGDAAGWINPVDISAATNVALYGDATKSPWFDYKIAGKTCFQVALNVFNYSDKGPTFSGVDRDVGILKFKKPTEAVSGVCTKIHNSELFKKYDNDITRFLNVRFTNKDGKLNGNVAKINGGLVLGYDRGLFDGETEIAWEIADLKEAAEKLWGKPSGYFDEAGVY